ncbi:MAG: DUF2062 domain-containing protein [Candidatus Omnitrophica bacterium]|nr:DUF2062 domain-containing protein [Candidatus Omnitrophota bacterium]
MENIRNTDNKIKAKRTIKELIIELLKLNNTPHEIALGIAIGVFIGITPLYGFHTLLLIAAAFLIKRVNKVAIFIGTNVSLPPTVPFITWAGYSIGRLMLGNKYAPLEWSSFQQFSYKKFLHLYFPLFIGSMVMGLALAVLAYFITRWFIFLKRRVKINRVTFLFILIFLCVALFNVRAYAGEKIIYAISPLGTAEYNDEGLIDLDGKKVKFSTFRFRLTGFDDLEKIYSDPKTFLPLKVERFVKFFFKKEYLVEEYTPEQNALVITKFVRNKKVKEYDFKSDQPISNAITLPFYLRTVKNLDIGWSYTASLPDKFELTLTSIDDIKVPAGEFNAYHFTSTPPKIEIWISKDEYRIPIKIKGLSGHNYIMVMKKHQIGEDK